MFSTDERVKQVWDSSILIICFQILPDQWQQYQQGVMKGIGVQDRLVSITFIAYWGLDVPLAYIFAFVFGLGYKGLWLSMIIAQGVLAVAFTRETSRWFE